jgi:hypothetical protein
MCSDAHIHKHNPHARTDTCRRTPPRAHTVSDTALMQVPHRMHNAPRLHTVGVSTLGIPAHAHGSFRNEKCWQKSTPCTDLSIDSTRAPIPPGDQDQNHIWPQRAACSTAALRSNARTSPGVLRGSLGLQEVICFHSVFRFMQNPAPSCKVRQPHMLAPSPAPSLPFARERALFFRVRTYVFKDTCLYLHLR